MENIKFSNVSCNNVGLAYLFIDQNRGEQLTNVLKFQKIHNNLNVSYNDIFYVNSFGSIPCNLFIFNPIVLYNFPSESLDLCRESYLFLCDSSSPSTTTTTSSKSTIKIAKHLFIYNQAVQLKYDWFIIIGIAFYLI